MTALTDSIRKAIHSHLTAKPMPEKRVRTRHIIGTASKKRRERLRWPFHSDALGVNPEQCEQAEAAARANGVPVEFDRETGAAIITGPDQYQKLAKASGMKTGRDGYEIPGVATGRQEAKNREARRRLIQELAAYPADYDP
ncbi:MAG: hypothetical protein E6Q97_17440 [Desulfurellales bacterium]|nr:MAG: hypothetical protein E6Q97_17440 [Desulfurellales bacterium]